MKRGRNLTDEEKQLIKKMYESGMTISQIYRELGVHYYVVYYYVKYHDWETDENMKNPKYQDQRMSYPNILVEYLKGEDIQNYDFDGNNVYLELLKVLNKYKNGITAKRIAKKFDGKFPNFNSRKVASLLRKLKEDDFVKKEKKLYYLTEKGKDIVKYLFQEQQ